MKGVFLGYKSGMKGYVVYDLQTHDIFVSRHVIFHELVFPYKQHLKDSAPWQYVESRNISPVPIQITPPLPLHLPSLLTHPHSHIHLLHQLSLTNHQLHLTLHSLIPPNLSENPLLSHLSTSTTTIAIPPPLIPFLIMSPTQIYLTDIDLMPSPWPL